MRVFVAEATGAIGKQPVPRLVAAGHEVYGMTCLHSATGRELGMTSSDLGLESASVATRSASTDTWVGRGFENGSD